MKRPSTIDLAVKNTTLTQPSTSTKVCIHVLKKARTDYRLLREATALLEAGYVVTIVDVEDEATRP